MEQRDFDGARPLLEKYLKQNPGDARALFDLGYIEDAAGHQDAAAADYRKAIAADPKQFEAHLALGLLLAHQSKWDEAREQVQQATLLEAPNPGAKAEAFRTLAELDRASDPPAARDALVAALQLSPETPADLLLTAQIAEANDDNEWPRRPISACWPFIRRRPPAVAAEATAGLAQLLLKEQKYSDAEPLLRSASRARSPRSGAERAAGDGPARPGQERPGTAGARDSATIGAGQRLRGPDAGRRLFPGRPSGKGRSYLCQDGAGPPRRRGHPGRRRAKTCSARGFIPRRSRFSSGR